MNLQKLRLGQLKPADGATTVGDVNFPKVKLLLPFDGSNGATSTTDSSNANNTVSFAGTAQISTAQSKFGGSSLLLDGNSDYIYIANDDLDFSSTESFTLEFWVYFNDIDDGNIVNFYSDYSGASNGMSIDKSTSNVLRAHNGDSTRITGTTTVSAGQWYHIALSGTSGSYKLFLNGTQEGSTSSNGFTGGTTNKYIGTFYWAGLGGAVRLVNGYIEDFRITKGEARYTSNFTPPTSAHLTSAGDVNKHIVVNSDADGVAIGTGGINQARVAKAWANIDASQAAASMIQASYNISSMTDHGTGTYSFNFSTAMTDADYSVSALSGQVTDGTGSINAVQIQNLTTSLVKVTTKYYQASGGDHLVDYNTVCILIFGN